MRTLAVVLPPERSYGAYSCPQKRSMVVVAPSPTLTTLMEMESATGTRTTMEHKVLQRKRALKTTKTMTTGTITNHAHLRSHHRNIRPSLFALRVLDLDALMQTEIGGWLGPHPQAGYDGTDTHRKAYGRRALCCEGDSQVILYCIADLRRDACVYATWCWC